MIAKLKGLVDQLGGDHVVLDVGGVGYIAFCSGRTLAALAPGETAVLHIDTHVREDHIHLYGFGESAERDCFNLLQGVQGVGARVALGILSVLGPGELLQALAAEDRAALMQASGVGAKLAGRIVSELKDKVANLSLGPGALAAELPVPSGPERDAVSALVNLGYRPSDASGAVHSALGRLGTAADLESLIRDGLKELAQ